MKDDIHNTLGNIEAARENLKRLLEEGNISKASYTQIIDHDNEHKVSNDLSAGRRLKYLSSLKQLALLLGKRDFKTAKEKDYKEVMLKRKEAFTADETYYIEAKILKKWLCRKPLIMMVGT